MKSNDIVVDLAKQEPKLHEHYDIILHAAGKAHIVPKTPEEESQFYEANCEGTKRLCAALEKVGVPKSFVFISTVAVYGCKNGNLITEDHPLNGVSPYAKSKIIAEEFLTDWCDKNNVILTILRPSLLAGKNPPGNIRAMINGINKGFYVNIGGGKIKKSILMVNDIATLVKLSKDKGGIYNVCDTQPISFKDISYSIAKQLGKRKPLSLPLWIIKPLASVGNLLGPHFPINSYRLSKITEASTFSNHKAMRELHWTPLNVLENFKIQ